jgi:hypothetical protein
MSSDTINKLLDAAKNVTGSDYKTAQAIGTSRMKISDWRAGRQPAPPEDHALIAAVAGLDAEEHLVRAVLAKHRDTPKGERLLSALGNGLRAITAGVTSVFFASVAFLAPATKAEAAYLPSLTPTSDNV